MFNFYLITEHKSSVCVSSYCSAISYQGIRVSGCIKIPFNFQELVHFAHELESVVVVGSTLDYESLHNFTVTLRAADAGSPPLHADAQLIVELLDADDQNPAFSYEHYTAVIPDDAQKVTDVFFADIPFLNSCTLLLLPWTAWRVSNE